MSTFLLDIPDGIYGRHLHSQLWRKQYDKDIDRKTVSLLLFILKIDLLKIQDDCLKKALKNHLKEIDALDIRAMTDNKELIARVLEVRLLLNRKNIRSDIFIASNSYADVFYDCGAYEYLVRHIGLIRITKIMFDDQLASIFEKVVPIILDLKYPYWQLQLIRQLTFVYGREQCRATFEAAIRSDLAAFCTERGYVAAGWCLETLEAMGALDANTRLIERAKLFEREADEYVADKKPNTFYPRIAQTYSEGLQLIREIPNCREFRLRLQLKLQDAQSDDARMMSSVASSSGATIDVEGIFRSIVALNLDNFTDAFTALLSLPVIPEDLIEQAAAAQEKNESFLAKLFSTHVQLSALGKPVGFLDGKDAKANRLRMHQREVLMIAIKMIKDIIDIHSDLLPEAIFDMIKHIDTPFIPPARLSIITDGLHAGFQNDMLTASYLLMPQIEHCLRNLAKTSGISVTNYDEKQEFENTLGGTLEKMKGIISSDLLTELKSFLIDSNNVNFRNEILHGIMEPQLIQHYGYYLWWLTLKMTYQTLTYFDLPATDTVT